MRLRKKQQGASPAVFLYDSYEKSPIKVLETFIGGFSIIFCLILPYSILFNLIPACVHDWQYDECEYRCH